MKQDTTEKLLIKHEGLIYYTISYINGRVTDDAISVGYEALWRAIQTYDDSKGAEFSTYAVTCIKHALWDLYRSQRAVLDNEVFLEDLQMEVAYVETNEEEDICEPSEVSTLVQLAVDEALSKLSPRKQQIVQVWLESAMSATAIANEVGCSQSYVSQVIQQAKHTIRQELLNAGYCPESTGD